MTETARPFLLITIDTEGDNLWSRPREVTTRNATYLPRFQSLCESFGFSPVYLTDHDMAKCPQFREFGRDVLRRRTGEIGMHLHAWRTPPSNPITDDDAHYQPYLIEYPETVLRDKVAHMTDLLEQAFETPMTSHRAGRWSFDDVYARVLIEKGYMVDSSVTPHVTWHRYLGNPVGHGGSDYRSFPERPYFLSPGAIGERGDSPLLEVPVTIRRPPVALRFLFRAFPARSIPWRVLNKLCPYRQWLRPNGANRVWMCRLLDACRRRRAPCATFMLHSSELMPGGSPAFPGEEDVELLYEDLQVLFTKAAKHYRGGTFRDFYANVKDEENRVEGREAL